ncbi:MAG: hypothetical protein V4638_06300 [Bacteroidota bacterium]
MWRFLCITIVLLTLSSCSTNSNSEYELPKDVLLYDSQLISPFFIEQLTEDPIKEIPAWNDSLIKLLAISQIQIEAWGLDNSEISLEEFKFNFRRQGLLYKYLHTNNSAKPATTTEIHYKASTSLESAVVKKYYNELTNQRIVMLNSNDRIDIVRTRNKSFSDTTRIFGTIQKPKIIIHKSGNYCLSINFILDENAPVDNIASICEHYAVDLAAIKNAEMSVTYVNKKYQPQNAFHLNDEFIQTDLLATWEYENGMLHSYSRSINGNLIKDYLFKYAKNKLLKSFVYNQMDYSVKYN